MHKGSSGAGLPYGLIPVGQEPTPQPGEILAVLTARNEELRLPSCLRHLCKLGVDRVILIDNLSTDRTAQIAAADERVHLFTVPGNYAGSNFGVDWVNVLLDRYARGHWVFVGDVDELLVFPGADRIGLRPLCDHLDSLGSEALRALLLDCFPEAALADVRFGSDDDLLEAAPFFEVPRLYREATPDFPYNLEYGGIRERLFFPEADPRRPGRWLHLKAFNLGWRLRSLRRLRWFQALAPKYSPTVTCVPLVRWRQGARYIASNHSMAPMATAPVQPSGILLHFKFLQDFHERAVDAVARNAHWDGSREYRRYLEVVQRHPDFRLHGPGSLRYEGPDQLVALGLMRDTPLWLADRQATMERKADTPAVR
jgi:glycosyl transferase family 2